MTERPTYTEFAWAYDNLIEGATGKRLGFICEILSARGLVPPADLLDAGCGTGSYTAGLAERGFAVTGLDNSEALLAVSRRRMPQSLTWPPALVCGDLRELDAQDRYDAILCRGVLGDLNDADDRHRVLRNFARALRAPHGTLIMDVRHWISACVDQDQGWRHYLHTLAGELEFQVEVKPSPDRAQTLEFVEVVRTYAGSEPGTKVFHGRLYCWTEPELHRDLAAAGFGTIEIYGAYDADIEARCACWLVAVASL